MSNRMRPNDVSDERLVRDTRTLGEQVRLIDTRDGVSEDQQSRVVSQNEAHRLREETGLDLILVSNKSQPFVVKLMDYGKFRYEEQKREKQAAKAQRENNRGMKEFYFGVQITQHDYDTKLRLVHKALDSGHVVRVGVKNDRHTRSSLQRYQTLAEAARQDDFVIRRVLQDMGEAVQTDGLKIADRVVFADLRKAA